MVNQTRYNVSENKKKLPMADIEFVENPEPRCACVLLVDTSSSMYDNIGQLNEGIKELKKQLEEDDLASKRVEIAVVTFDTYVNIISDFTTVDNFEPTELETGGVTSMTEAINIASDLIAERKNVYKKNGVAYYRPWMFLITDGEPTDEEGYALEDSDSRFKSAVKTLHNGVNGKQFTFFAVGVDYANMDTLSKLSPKFPPKKLRENKWSEMFEWLSSSLVSLSSSSLDTERIKLRSTNSWDYVEI
ncbi:MAG: VWA domain-containing protein [Candidatus Gastranaerophilales bacterium]|nr:VWA domain-containing protein [Candidatus Gastranaerophilales bacterium]